MAKICMGCMNPLPEGCDTCEVCGFTTDSQNPADCLPVATVLQENYIVGRCTHEGSDSRIYIGYNRLLKEPCFIQEFYPGTMCERDGQGNVQPLGGCARSFAAAAESFRGLMRALARAKEIPGMIPVYDVFEEKGTFYGVSDHCAGITLSKRLRQCGGRLPWSEARPLFMPLLACVAQLHAAGIRHLAITPDNILISADGKAHLRNFAIPEARCVGGDLQPELTDGFSAPEQYDMTGTMSLGDATDVYGLAATLFYAVTGNVPPAGNKRAKNSDDLFMAAEIAAELTQPVCMALFNALLVSPTNRTASVSALRDQLGMEPTVSALIDEVAEDEEEEEAPRGGKGRAFLIVFLCILAALVLVGGLVLMLLGGRDEQPQESTQTTLPSMSTTTTTVPKKKQYAVPQLVGKNYYEERDAELQGELIITMQYMQYSDKPVGTVLSQEPAGGSAVDKGTEIKVIISCGKDDTVKVPDVSGWKQEHAKLYLEALGFKVEVATLQASTVEKGLVENTDPVAGTEKKKGDTITLRVSNVEQKQPEPTSTTTTKNTGSNKTTNSNED